MSYGLAHRDLIPRDKRDSSLRHHVQTKSGAHPIHQTGAGDSFSRFKEPGA